MVIAGNSRLLEILNQTLDLDNCLEFRMNPSDFVFFVFSFVTISSAVCVIFSSSSVHSVLWLILSFISAAGLFILLDAEFLAMLLVVVYVGAVAVLFLFVVMMLNADPKKTKTKFSNFVPVGILTALVIFLELGVIFGGWRFSEELYINSVPSNFIIDDNTSSLGNILYTNYFLPFQIAGIILLVAMIGAIILTLSKRDGVKRQDVLDQIYRDPNKSVFLKDIKPGQGL